MSNYRGGKEKERKGTITTPPHETSPIVFTEWRGSLKGKRILKRNACNSHLIPKMDEQTCHENPPQQNAPLAIKYESYQTFFIPFHFYFMATSSFFYLSNVEVVLIIKIKASEILTCLLSSKTYLYGEIIRSFYI